MVNYPPRRARIANLVVGIVLVLFAVAGLAAVTATSDLTSDFRGSVVVIFVFVFMGGYEIGKFYENRIESQNRKLN